MDSVLRILADHSATALLVLALGYLGLLLAIYILGRKMAADHGKWRRLLDDTRGENLEKLLYDHLRGQITTQERLDSLDSHVEELQRKSMASKQFVGLVRYDAFPEVGGNQSFALAICDERGDGCIVTSLVGRNDCRVYCKPLASGRSDRTLSQEEQRAIREARSDAPKAVVTQ
ncbi:MAG TPA: DUF4446 family protein [Fimbriimonadaceae bacterium]|nr:DUF4446 family protein [Fimbriimonadaceae bacterium]